MSGIEQEIKKIIEDIVCGKYIGKLEVYNESLDNCTLWTLCLYLDTEYSPMVLSYEGSEEDFKEFIRNEIKSKKLHYVSF